MSTASEVAVDLTYDNVMQLLLPICMIIACLPIAWPGPPLGLGPTGSAVMTAVVVVALLFVARTIARSTVVRSALEPENHAATARSYGRRRYAFVFLNLGAMWFVLLACGWGWAVRESLSFHQYVQFEDEPVDHPFLLPGAEFVVLAPYLITMIGSWAIFFDAERVLQVTGSGTNTDRREFWTRRGYVGFLLRQNLLVLFLPVLLTIIQLSVLRVFPDLLTNVWAKAGGFAAGFAFILLVPTLVPFLLGLQPMPAGALRNRLEAAAKRIGVRYRDLYVWDTRGHIATAMVTGLIPRLRPIVFTDLLIRKLKDDEIEAVFGHEVGHVRHGHLLYYLVFLLLSFLTLGAAYRAVELSGGISWLSEGTALVLSVLVAGCYLFVFFGFISRRCERQADVFGCKTVSCVDPACANHEPTTAFVHRSRSLCRTGIDTFVRALATVEEVNGSGDKDSSDRGTSSRAAGLVRFVGVWLSTWQHGTIAKRIEFLKTLDERTERRFQLRVTMVRWAAVILLLAGIVAVSLWSGWQTVIEGA
ncbi:MAG TPA: M48 family metallopeptidase [Gemmataceae bacterium]|jgi:Zn-dependent protease with chaperone function|nr:M48 family metallopeptidase [Gemmataceae bacterium]